MNPWYISLVVLALIALPLLLRRLHRLLLRLEERGWIYYVRKKPQGGALSSMVPLHEIVEPGQRHVVQAQERMIHEAPARDLLLARLLSLLQADSLEVAKILEELNRAGEDAPALYARAWQIVAGADPERASRLPSLEAIKSLASRRP